MNVFSDYIGHLDLYYSFHLLFEKRFGFKLYRPTNNFQSPFRLKTITLFDFQIEKVNKQYNSHEEYFINHYDYKQNLITFEQFLELDIDIILSTSWENEESLYNLYKKYKPNALFIRHIANIHEIPYISKNILLSTTTPMPDNINYIIFHPEHQSIYHENFNVYPDKIIKGFNRYICPVYEGEYKIAYDSLVRYKDKLVDFKVDLQDVYYTKLHTELKNAMFIWHTKPLGCCGYTARQSLFCGKPLIVNKSYSKFHNTLANEYLKDGVNCIDIDPTLRSFDENINLILKWSDKTYYNQICENGLKFTKSKINFEKESDEIKTWINKLC